MSDPELPAPDAASLGARVAAMEQSVQSLEARMVVMAASVDGLRALLAVRAADVPTLQTAVRSSPAPDSGAPSAGGAPATIGAAGTSAPAAAPSLVGGAPGIPVPKAPAKARKTGAEIESAIAGRWLNRIGLIAVAIGVSYFLKYAIDNAWIGPIGQVAIGIVIGAGLLASVPWFLRRDYRYFADGLTGLAAAILYLSVWAGGGYYHLYSPLVALGAMVVVTASLVAIALGRNSQTVAVIALIGGFVSPLLVSTGEAAETSLFSYLAVLDAALLPVAFARDWRAIEWPAFLCTELYFWLWFADQYHPDRLGPTTIFAAIFFGIFLVLPALAARRGGRVRAAQAFLLPMNAGLCLLAFAAMLWPEQRWTLALVTLAIAGVHLVVARLVPEKSGESQARLLFAGVALTLATIVIPIRLSGHAITIAWAVEGAVLMWTGFRTRVGGIRALAFLLLFVTTWRLFAFPLFATRVLVNGRFATELTEIACLAVVLWLADRHKALVTSTERVGFGVIGVAINLLALWALTAEVQIYFGVTMAAVNDSRLARELAISVLWTAYASALLAAGVRKHVAALRWQALALFGITTLKVFFNDLDALDGFYRIASAVALGVVLLVVSFVYQRNLAASRPPAAPPGTPAPPPPSSGVGPSPGAQP